MIIFVRGKRMESNWAYHEIHGLNKIHAGAFTREFCLPTFPTKFQHSITNTEQIMYFGIRRIAIQPYLKFSPRSYNKRNLITCVRTYVGKSL